MIEHLKAKNKTPFSTSEVISSVPAVYKAYVIELSTYHIQTDGNEDASVLSEQELRRQISNSQRGEMC